LPDRATGPVVHADPPAPGVVLKVRVLVEDVDLRHTCSTTAREDGMLFMVIERFRDDDMVPVYRRLRETGRQLPEGLSFVDSWVEPSFARCFQLMRCDDPLLLQQWVLGWRGTGVTFEIVPVVASAQTREIVEAHLGEPP
jgi:hypothetical protein